MAMTYNFSADTIINEGRTTQTALNEVKEWLPKTNFPALPDQLIVLFLLSCNNSILATEQAIYTNLQIKNQKPEIFNDRDVNRRDLKKVSETIYSFYLPKRTDRDQVVHFSRLRDTYFANFDMIPMIKYGMMYADYLCTQKPPHGLIIITDMTGLTLLHLTRLKIHELGTFFKFVQEALPIKPTEIHILNANHVFTQLFKLTRPFMNQELVQMINIYPSSDCRGCVPRKLLPEEYGGDMPNIEELNKHTVVQLKEMKPYFDAEERLRKPLIFPN